MTIHEPMTLATDYLLAAATFWFALRLLRLGRDREQTAPRLWGAAFLASATAAFTGGTFHGFASQLGPTLTAVLWKATVYAVGAASLFLLAAAARAGLAGRARRWLLAAAALQFVVYALWMTVHDDFRYVIYDYAPALVLVLLLQIHGWARRRDPAAPWIIAGVLASFAAAGVQMARLAFSPLFNHNDLYHLVQIGAFWLLYRGGLWLRDAEGRASR